MSQSERETGKEMDENKGKRREQVSVIYREATVKGTRHRDFLGILSL